MGSALWRASLGAEGGDQGQGLVVTMTCAESGRIGGAPVSGSIRNPPPEAKLDDPADHLVEGPGVLDLLRSFRRRVGEGGR